jgi:gas vesicle protein
MNSSKVLLGVLGGVAAGAIAGILFAPAKGKKTRRRIMKKGENYADDIKSKFQDLYENVNDKCDSMLGEAKELVARTEMKK